MEEGVITARLKLQAEGVKETAEDTGKIRNNLDQSTEALQRFNRAASGAQKVRAAAMAGAANSRENLEYNQMRGIAGATGAASRDFAEQSRGLGGLVRLYATFAANIFAVSAAFNVLRDAANTSSLIEGLNTLGAVSGKSLGSLSKQLVQASDGAISLSEAMSSVAMTSSAGMTSQNILRLGAVAKNASIALGISMPDALNRLSRGVTKLEPELLDELGIFTKIEPATQAYALQLGKAVSQLTDFEKRQAFANAVVKEGEEKFAALADSKANPYDKLLASLKNVAFSGLELLNTVLKPIVEILASSPTALALGLTAIIAAIVKKALPAVADLRAAFGKTLERQAEETTQKLDFLKKGYDALTQYTIKSATDAADARVAAVDKAEKKILEFYKNSAANTPQGALLTPQPAFKQILQDNPLELTQKSLAELKIAHADYVTQVTSGNRKLTEQEKTRIALEREFINTLETQLAGEVNFSAVKQRALADAEKALQSNKLAQSYEKDLQAIKKQGAKDSIIQTANMRAGVLGIGIAFQLLKLDIENANLSLSNFEKNMLLARGAGAILTGKLLSGLNAVGGALTGIAIAATVFSLFEAIFSKNEKQIQKFNASLDSVNDSVDNTKRTLAELDRAGLAKSLTDQAIAISNAFTEISDSAKRLVQDAKLAKEASTGWFDRIVEGFKDFFGYGIDDKVARGLSKQLISALDLLRRSDIDEKYRERFKELLQVKDLSAGTVEDALNRLGEGVRERFTSLLESARKELDKLRSDLESFRDASDKALKSYQEFLQSTASTDPLFKLGDSMQILADSMITAMNRGTKGIMAAFEELSKDPRKAALFGPEFVKQFVEIEQGFKEQANGIRAYEGELKKYQQLLDESRLKEKKLAEEREKNSPGRIILTRDERTQQRITKQLEDQVELYKNAINYLPTDKIDRGRELFLKGLDIAFEQGSKYIAQATGNAMQQASINIAKANSLVLSGERAVEESTRIKVQEINIQISAIKTNIDLIKTNELLAAETSALRASVEYSRISQDKNATEEEKRFAYEQKVATDIIAKVLSGTMKAADIFKTATELSQSVPIGPEDQASVPVDTDPKRIAKQSRAAVQNVQTKLAAQDANLIVKESEKQSTLIEGIIQKQRAELADKNKLLSLENDYNQLLISRRGSIQSIAGITTKEIIQQEGQLELEQLRKKQAIERSTIQLAYEQAGEKFMNTGNKQAEKEANYQKQLLDATDKKNNAEIDNLNITIKKRELDQEILDLGKKYEIKSSNIAKENAEIEAGLQIARAQFTSKAELYNLDKQYTTNVIARMDIEKSNFEAQKQINDAAIAAAKAKEEAEIKLRYLKDTKGEDAYLQAVNAEQERQNTLLQNRLFIITSERDARNQLIEIQRKQNIEQEKQNELTSRTQILAEALASAMGTTGEKLGNITSTLIKNYQETEKGSNALKTIQSDLIDNAKQLATASSDESKDELGKKRTEILDAESKQISKNKETELKGNAQIIGDTKKLFKEKTTAYKAFAAVERAIHIVRITQKFIEMAADIKSAAVSATVEGQKTAVTIGGTLERMGAYATDIFGKSIRDLGPIAGTAVAVGLIATLYALLGRGSSSKPAFVPTAEQQQKVQGTAMGYDSTGKEVQVRRGVFGDTEAKSESIAKSLERIKETSVDGLSYDNKILNTLKSIDSGINQTAKRLYNVQGLRTGSMFDTATGTKTGGGFLGISQLFGSSTSTEIRDAGILLNASFGDLASGVNQGAVNFYEEVQRTVKKSGFLGLGGSTKTYIDKNVRQTSSDITKFFTDIFSNAQTLLTDLAVKTGTNTEQGVKDILSKFEIKDLKITLKGLSGEALAKEVESVISSILDDATLAVFQSFEKYADFGEGLLETVIRVVDNAEKVNQQIRNIGITGVDISKNYDVTEALIKAADGFDNFISKTQYFRENFLTEAERIAPISKAVGEELARLSLKFPGLGIESVDTRKEFAALVKSIEGLGKGGEELLGSLLNLQKDFIESTKIQEKIAEERTSLEEELAKLTMTQLELREKEIDKLDESNRELKRQIFRTQDFVNTTKALENSLKSVIDTLKSQIQVLKDYKANLLLGDQSTLNTIQQYALAKTNVEQLLATINKAAVTPEEIKIRSDAISKLTGATDRFLNLSRSLYASGAQYTVDLNTILSIIDSVEGTLSTQLTDAEKQLLELKDSNKFLESIDNSSKTTAQLIEQYLVQGGKGITVGGSFAAGTNYVSKDMVAQVHKGERIIPAADNFKLMTTTNNTNIYNREMLLEIQRLNQKIDSLEQTVANGAVINANATNRNTEEIAQAVIDSISKSAQATRLQNKVSIK